MELSTIIKNNCIFDLSRGCGNRSCNQRHIPNNAFKSESVKYINTPSSIPGIVIDVDAFRKIVVEKSEGYKLRHKMMICLYYITNQECYNCSAGRTVTINVKYFGHTIPVKICYRNMSKCKQWCTWGMHIDFIYQSSGNKLKYSELQFEHTPLEKRKPVIQKRQVTTNFVEQFPSLPSKKKESVSVEKPVSKMVAPAPTPAPTPAPAPKKRWVVHERELPFTVHDLIDKKAEILATSKMRMIRRIDQLQEESSNFLKRNIDLVDEMNARKLVPRTCVSCDHCHKPLGIKRCRGCFVKESPHLMSYFYP